MKIQKMSSDSSNKRARLGFDKPIVDVWQREVGQISSRRFAHHFAASECLSNGFNCLVGVGDDEAYGRVKLIRLWLFTGTAYSNLSIEEFEVICCDTLKKQPKNEFMAQDLVLKLDVLRKLEKHRGCVNTVSFNAAGDILVSGSDDRKVILWDWETGRIKLSFHSRHCGNVFQAKFMPYSDDRSIVTCGADGLVRYAEIADGGDIEISSLGSHDGRAHKLAIEPGSPHVFYTCGEDGLVQHFDLRTKANTKLLTCSLIDDRRSYTPINQLNTIAIDPRNPYLFAVGGADEYARLYDIRKYKWDGSNDFDQPVDFFCPQHLIGDERVGITGVAFSDSSELLVSYNDENIYLFTKDMGLGSDPVAFSPSSTSNDSCDRGAGLAPETNPGDVETDEKPAPQVYKGHRNCDTVKGVGFFGPRCEYVVSGSDCGRIFIWKKKGGELIRVMEADEDVVNCIEPHPHIPMLASSGIEHNIKIWTPNAEQKATLPPNIGEFKPRQREWIYNVAPRELLIHLAPRHGDRSISERRSREAVESSALLQLMLNFGRHSDDDSSENGAYESGPEDFFS
ncbi:hypothetical protein V2J09_015565 [Rumex salicifolius]